MIPPFVIDEATVRDPLYLEQLLEWIGLATLGSPRISSSDSVDRYLCDYRLPDDFELSKTAARREQSIVHLQWRGMAGAAFVTQLWLELRKAVGTEEGHWFSMGVSMFEEKMGFTVLCPDGKQILLWEYD